MSSVEEIFEVLDTEGAVIGLATRSEVHSNLIFRRGMRKFNVRANTSGL